MIKPLKYKKNSFYFYQSQITCLSFQLIIIKYQTIYNNIIFITILNFIYNNFKNTITFFLYLYYKNFEKI